jgi:ferrous iron transport protein B
MMKKRIKIALAGNPNSGKTTIFNSMTGTRQQVGNYPGVTVEKKIGMLRHGDVELELVDLPGTYSLSAASVEERVARDFLINERPDVVIDVLDASNLERNLYLATQIMELGIPLLLAFNMSDVAEMRGMVFDLDELSELLHAPIIATVAHKHTGIDKLLAAAVERALPGKPATALQIDYGPDFEESLARISAIIAERGKAPANLPLRWLALKLLEHDPELEGRHADAGMLEDIKSERERLGKIIGADMEEWSAERRYGFISGACQEAIRSTVELRHTNSDRIDGIIIHRFWGLPIFLGMMYLVFWATFTVGGPPMDWIDGLFGWLGDSVGGLWPAESESMLKSLLVDGIIGGVGGVIIFLPNIMILFLAIAILEDTGYMARAAFLMDRLMHKLGLHGKSFIPMLTGFGCSIPAIMSTRILESERDRMTTMLVLPLMSCGARLPIYALIIPAFFAPHWHAPMLWLIYLIGILLAIICAKLLRSTLFKGETVPFVMELPPYRLPTMKGVLLHTWKRSGLYLKKAGTVILAISIVLWALTSYPKTELDPTLDDAEQIASLELSNTVAGRIGQAMEPLIKPLGFDWRIGTAMIGAFAAKEVFVAQLGIVYSVGEADEESQTLREKLRANYSPLTGFCIMLFMLISAPCMATIAVTRRESNSWKWALFQLGGLTLLAYALTLIVYQLGSLLGIGV